MQAQEAPMTRAKRQQFVGDHEVGDFKKCRYCPARLVWVRADNGKAVPLEYDSRAPAMCGGWMLEVHWGNCPGAEAARAKARRDRAHREVPER